MNKRKKATKNSPPATLTSTDEYLEAPVGTVAALDGAAPIYKTNMAEDCPDDWKGADANSPYQSSQVSGVTRNVLRWGRKS